MSDIGPVVPPPPVAATNPAAPPASQPAPAVPQQPSGQGGQPLPQPQQQPQSPSSGGDPAAQISAALRELAQGGQITAQVIARDNAALLVRTAAGATLALNNLAAVLEQANIAVLNAALKLQLNPANPNQATVTQANGTALQPPLAATAQPPTAAQLALAVAPPQQAAPAAPITLPQLGQSLPAVVVSAPPPAAAPPGSTGLPATAPALPLGSQLQVVVKSIALPAPVSAAVPGVTQAPSVLSPNAGLPAAATGPVPAAASPPVALPAATTSGAPAVVLPSQAQPAATPPAGPGETRTLLNAQLASRAAPLPLPAAPAVAVTAPVTATLAPSAPTATLIVGIVSGPGQAGQVLVSTPQGTLSLSLPQPLPAGTQISFEFSALVRPPGPAATTLGPAPLSGILTRLRGEWPVLQQTLDAIRAADPALAQRLQTDLLPQPNGRLASTALQFMAAAAIGSAQAWLGAEAVRKLEQSGRGDLLRKLDEDFRELGRLNQRQGDNDWQALVMPMLVGGRVEPIQIFMRRRRDAKRQQQQTRFIIDFDLESTGPIQFDGFVGVKQLDLILRSESEFGPAFRLDVTKIFTEALEITGMAGSIRFHDHEPPLAWPSPELEAAGPSTEIKA